MEEPTSSAATLPQSLTQKRLRSAMLDTPHGSTGGCPPEVLAPQHHLNDLQDQAERLIARGMTQSFVEVRRAETARSRP